MAFLMYHTQKRRGRVLTRMDEAPSLSQGTEDIVISSSASRSRCPTLAGDPCHLRIFLLS